jgi:hypothetical protein
MHPLIAKLSARLSAPVFETAGDEQYVDAIECLSLPIAVARRSMPGESFEDFFSLEEEEVSDSVEEVSDSGFTPAPHLHISAACKLRNVVRMSGSLTGCSALAGSRPAVTRQQKTRAATSGSPTESSLRPPSRPSPRRCTRPPPPSSSSSSSSSQKNFNTTSS